MAFGFGVLRLSSRAFWAMSPREINAAYIGIYGEGSTGILRASFATLMERFPDSSRMNMEDHHDYKS